MSNEVKKISDKQFNFVKGLSLILLSFCLIVNVGVPIRILTYPFAYLFGLISWLFYILFTFIGISLLTNKKISLKLKLITIVAIILLFVGFSLLFTFIICERNGVLITSLKDRDLQQYSLSAYKSIRNNTYSKYLFDDLKISSLGGGLFGFFLLGLLNGAFSKVGGLIITILIISLGIFLAIYPYINNFKKQTKSDKLISKKENSPKKNKNSQGILNIELIKTAGEIPLNYTSEIESSYVKDVTLGTNNAASPTMQAAEVYVKAKFIRDLHEETEDINSKTTYHEDYIRPILSNENKFSSVVPQEEEHQVVEEKIKEEPLPFVNEEEPVISPIDNTQVQINTPVQPQVQTQPQIQPQKEIQPQIQVEAPKPIVWVAPSSELLQTYETSEANEQNQNIAIERQGLINKAFQDFGVGASIVDFTVGPSVTRYNVKYEANVSSRSVNALVQDISIRLGGVSARFESVVEGQSTSGLEIPNAMTTTVSFKEVYNALPDVKKHPLSVAFGKNIKGEVVCADFDEFPHMLVAGTTGSGKSIFVNSIISTLIMRNSPENLKIVLVDPKKVEMTRYKDMPHLLCPIITEPQKVKVLMTKLVQEMTERYDLFEQSNGATNIKEYNEDQEAAGKPKMPYIVCFLDEYADLIDQCKELSLPVVSIAQKARACGIHILISTQRPSTNVVTGVIKANLPTHVALMTASSVDSTTIIGEGGAEKLLGKGDMLVQSPLVSRVGCVRLQGCYINRHEISRVVNYLKNKYETYYDPKFLNLEEESDIRGKEEVNSPEFQGSAEANEETRYQEIKQWVMSQQFMSISRMQRECSIGFNRAGRFFIRLQNEGVVDTAVEGNKGCRVLVNDDYANDEDNVVTSDEQSMTF